MYLHQLSISEKRTLLENRAFKSLMAELKESYESYGQDLDRKVDDEVTLYSLGRVTGARNELRGIFKDLVDYLTEECYGTRPTD